jgi:hypothetical protein
VVCGDTGLSHLATALGTPSVTLFGPSPGRVGAARAAAAPAASGGRHVALWAARPGERGDPHAGTPDPALLRPAAAGGAGGARGLPERAARPEPARAPEPAGRRGRPAR